MIVVALDYKDTKNPLTCTVDGNNIVQLAHSCQVADLVTVYDRQATTPNVTSAISYVGQRCVPGDYFIFFYAGHGSQLPDQDGDEKDGSDEAYCLVDAQGGLSAASFLRDDDFCRCVSSSVPKGVNILILSDCCHAGTVADFDKPEWTGHKAMSISGCTDKQTSGDTGSGGIFTHSLLMAVEKLNRWAGQQPRYSIGTLYRATLEKDDGIFKSPQAITMQAVRGVTFDSMAWPLVPPRSYQAPWTVAQLHGYGGGGGYVQASNGSSKASQGGYTSNLLHGGATKQEVASSCPPLPPPPGAHVMQATTTPGMGAGHTAITNSNDASTHEAEDTRAARKKGGCMRCCSGSKRRSGAH